MLRMYENNDLTVYNGTEEQDILTENGGPPALEFPCCEPNGMCEFDLKCKAQLQHYHRKLLLGEPLGREVLQELKHSVAYGLDSWSFLSIQNAIKSAFDFMESLRKDRKHLENTALDYDQTYLFTGVMLLKLYIQLNFTGPHYYMGDVKPHIDAVVEACESPDMNSILKEILELDGVEIDSSVRAPVLLVAARHFLSSLKTEHSLYPFYIIWQFRCDFFHQRLLTGRCWTLSKRLKLYADTLIQWKKEWHHQMEGFMDDAYAMFLCEVSEMLMFYYDGILSEKFIDEAMRILNLKVELSGRKGFRTKFQQTPSIQMFANAVIADTACDTARATLVENEQAFFPFMLMHMPRTEYLFDDTRLDRVRWADESDEPTQPLRGIDEVVVLAFMHHKQNFQRTDELTREETEALVNLIIDNPVTWTARVTALLTRCINERGDRRAVDRCIRQLELLINLVQHPEGATEATYRQYLFYGYGFMSLTDVKKLFGEVLESIDHWKEALRLYQELGVWDKVILCYKMMNLRHKAEELVLEKIKETGETPKLLVLLGDATSDVSHYEKAWTLSNGRCVESQVKLADHYFRLNEYDLAINHYRKVIQLAPLDYPIHLRLAWCCFKLEIYDEAFQSYLKAANLEYDNFLVWNNLATCALKLNKKDYALRAYKLAVKCNYDEWKVWDNILTVATDLKEIEDAMIAYHRVLDLKKGFFDEKVLTCLFKAIFDETPTPIRISSVGKLIGRITSSSSKGPHPWLEYARYFNWTLSSDSVDNATKIDNYEKSLFYFNKGITIMRQHPDCKTDTPLVLEVIRTLGEFRAQRCREPPEGTSEKVAKNYDPILRSISLNVYKTTNQMSEIYPSPEWPPVIDAISCELDDPYYKTCHPPPPNSSE